MPIKFPLLKTVSLLFALMCCHVHASAQSAFQPLGQPAYDWMDRFEIKSGRFFNNIHTSVKPYMRNEIVAALNNLDTMKVQPKWSKVDMQNMHWLRVDNDEWSHDTSAVNHHPVFHTFYKRRANFYSYTDPDFMIMVDPVVEFGYGYEQNVLAPYIGKRFVNTRGVELRGWVSRKLGFYFEALENQFRPPTYVQQYITAHKAIPHAGYYKSFKATGYDYFNARGYVAFKVLKPITVTFGTDRNVIGNGDRSLLLSDFSNDYLFLKLQTRVWRIEYTNIFCEGIENYDVNKGDQLLPKRFAAFHHLSLNATRWLNVGLFEGIIFARRTGFELNYLNPIIFYRAAEQGLGSPDNAVMGLDWKANALHHISFYGQFLLDDLNVGELRKRNGYWGNKYGMQAGLKYVDAFTLKNLDLQGEINWVKPYTYSHSDSLSDYTNYNLPYAHPLGANFKEAIGIARYQPFQKLQVTVKTYYDLYGIDPNDSTNYGGNIRKIATVPTIVHPYGNTIAQGIRVKQVLASGDVSYEVYHNIYVDAYALVRVAKRADVTTRNNTRYAQLTVRWNIPSRHYEF